ncbi:hypothetical protein EXIGLDRAFT_284074 [Exidia glandulosa HHB12029]|uniref:Uncharacterized protein n=1 Tax=Exidia glandulosa HHB12029 TaxID=1314781 RepID=A0A165DHL1_EXIGL|nr:hypothetical protein EXIGLDRAFT_284074 [Exidia glandulosa HHB12029]
MLNALLFASLLGGFARAQLAPSPVPSGPNFELLDNANSSVWSFDGQWGHFSAASPCPSCLAQPDPAQVQDGTWSDTSTEGASATLVFTGVGLSVFNFCPGPIASSDPAAPPILFRSNFSFAIDGKPHGALQLADGCAGGDVYNQLVFTVSGLTNGRHTFTITNNASSSDLLLDFAVAERAPKSVPPPVTTITVPPITSTGTTTSTAPPAGTPTPARPPAASNPPPSSPPPIGATIHTLDNISPQVVLQGPWGTFTAKTPCPDCLVKPDFAQTFDDSYSELSGEGSATISWTGTSIFLYGICPGTVGTAQFVQSFSFSLDGADAGRHASPAGGCAKNVYRQLLFSKTGLSLSAHKLVITNVQDDVFGRTSDLLLDFAVFDSAGVSEPVPPSGPALPPSGPVSGGLPPPSNPPSSPVPSGAGFLLLDDTSPQIVYDDNWGAISQKAPCAKCATHFDFSKLSHGTYHELSKPGSATIQFAGTGVSVYGVCPGTLSPSGQFLQKFTLAVDGQTDSFAGPKGGCSVNVYNQLLFEVTGLPKGQHTATIRNLDSGFTNNPSDLVLDFVVVTTGGLSQPATPALQPSGSGTPSTSESGGTLPPPSNPPASPAAPTGANFRKLDDTSPQIAYDGAWGVISKDAPCASCVTKFDFSQTFKESYHELTTAGTATIAFAGTELYLYGVCPGTLDGGGQFLQVCRIC